MARAVYISALEARSGKSVVSLGLMEMLSARVERLGFFRPIMAASGERDPQIELIRERYQLDAPYEEMGALGAGEARALLDSGDRDQIAKRVVASFRALERRCDVIVCEGADIAEPAHALDLDLDAQLANELDAAVLLVLNGASVADDAPHAVRMARDWLEQRRCSAFGVIVNRVPEGRIEEVTVALRSEDGAEPVYVLPEREELAYPTVGDVADALGGGMLFHSPETLQREVRDVRVAAMSVEHFVEGLTDGTLVIVPPDRTDILVASMASTVSAALPSVAGILLTVGTKVEPTVLRLLQEAPFPVLRTPSPTYVAATAVHDVRPRIMPGDQRKIASALGLFESGVDVSELERRMAVERPARLTPLMFEYELVERAKSERRRVVLPEGDDDRVLRAADILLRRDVVELTILGPHEDVHARAAALGLDISQAHVIDPLTAPMRVAFAERYHELRGHKGVTEDIAHDTMGDPSYFGTMMVHEGVADGMVSGAAHTTGDTIRPAFEFIRARPGASVVSSVFFMCLPDRVLVYGDCAVNPSPDAEQLADIAIGSAETASAFGIEPRVALLSYSTGESGKGGDVDKVRLATGLVRERRPDLAVEGPIQYDAAVDAAVAQVKLPESDVAGRATVFIFPDLDTGNVAYKAVQRSAGATAVGPVLQGLRKPVNDLSRGCTVTDIVNTVAITAIQAQDGRGVAAEPAPVSGGAAAR